MAGDWNEQSDDPWFSALFEALGLSVHVPDGPTRWEGNRTIDYYFASQEVTPSQPSLRKMRFSDHIVVQMTIEMLRSGRKDQMFLKQKTHTCPTWLAEDQWKECFNEAYIHGAKSEWSEVCFLLHAKGLDMQDDDEQGNVAFLWNYTLLKNIWSFGLACYVALLELPDDWDDFVEVKRVAYLANHLQWKRLKLPRLSTSSFPRSGDEHSEAFRKLSNLHARACELRQNLMRDRHNDRRRDSLKNSLVGMRLSPTWSKLLKCNNP